MLIVNNQYFTDGNTLLGNLPYGYWEDNDNSLMYPDIQGLQGLRTLFSAFES